MTSIITNRFLLETWENKYGQEDPLFERVPATQLHAIPLKPRRKISEHDCKVLTKVKRRAYHLDMGLGRFCGVRIGWGSVIGIIPGVGDVLDTLMAIMVIGTCQQIEGGLPTSVKLRMYLYMVFDFIIGLIPIIGDVADALFRANVRNAIILEEHLQENGSKTLRGWGGIPLTFDHRDPEEYWHRENGFRGETALV